MTGDDHDSEDEDEITADDILDSAVGFIEETAESLGIHVLPLFEQALPLASTIFDPNGAYLIRLRVIGMFASVFASIGAAAVDYVDDVLPLIQQGLRDKSAGVRQNSAYALRVSCEVLKERLHPNYPSFLQVRFDFALEQPPAAVYLIVCFRMVLCAVVVPRVSAAGWWRGGRGHR